MSEFAKFTLSFRVNEASLTFRANTIPELEGMVKEAEKSELLTAFDIESDDAPAEEPNAVTEMVEKTDPEAAKELRQAAVDRLLAEKKAEAATGLTGDEAQAAVTKHLGAGEELATNNQIIAAAKKSGKTVEELAGISVNEAKRLIKEGAK